MKLTMCDHYLFFIHKVTNTCTHDENYLTTDGSDDSGVKTVDDNCLASKDLRTAISPCFLLFFQSAVLKVVEAFRAASDTQVRLNGFEVGWILK